MVDSHGGLSIAVLIYYAPGLILALLVCHRQGWAEAASWRFLVLLPLVRIVGAACTLAAESKPSVGLYTAAAICNSIGLVPLIATLTAIDSRINDCMPYKTPEAAFIAHHLASIAALVLAIVGGVDMTSTDSSKLALGHSLRKASGVILLVIFLITAAYTIYLFTRRSVVWHGDRKLLLAGTTTLPFILIRALYLMLTAFDSNSKTFNNQQPNIFAQAFLQVAMEFIAFAIFIAGGLMSPPVAAREDNKSGSYVKAREGTPSHDLEHDAIPLQR